MTIRFVPGQPYISKPNGHKFAVGDVCTLCNLETYPEYNGETVTIVNIRDDGPYGKAYYVEGRINKVANWVYETRLTKP